MRGKLYQRICDTRTLYQAFQRIRQKRVHSGVDDQTVSAFEQQLNRRLRELSGRLREDRYVPEPSKRVRIPKPGKPGEMRSIAIASLEDKIVQEAARSTIEPIFNPLFLDCSFAYRPNFGPHRAIEQVERHIQSGNEWATVCDIDNFFDTIDHGLLMKRVRDRIWEPGVIRLIELWLKMGVIERARWVDVEAGVPQGSIISPLLSNIYLHSFDQEMTEAGHALVRYGDDCIVLSPSYEAATLALKTATAVLEQLRLKLNLASNPIARVKAGFVFLGFLFKGEQKMIAPGKLQQMQRQIRAMLADQPGSNLNHVVNGLNETLSGWRRYYGMGDVADQFLFLETVLADQLASLIERQRAAGLMKNAKDARLALQRIRWLTEMDFEQQERFVDRVFERLNRRKSTIEATSQSDSDIQGQRGGNQTAPTEKLLTETAGLSEKVTQAGDLMKPSMPVDKAVALKRRQVEKELSREAELVISQRGLFLGKTQRRVVVRERGKTVKEIPFFRVKTISLTSDGVSLSTDIIRYCAYEGIPIHFIDYSGRPYAHLVGPRFPLFNLTRAQARAATERSGLELAAAFVGGKIRNQINLIKYYAKTRRRKDEAFAANCDEAISKIQALLDQIEMIIADEDIKKAHSRLFALEGHSASHYWRLVKNLLSTDVFFTGRQRKGATDLVNSLLNYGYGILYGRVYEALIMAGLNPNISFLHAEQIGKPTLVFDLVEEFRQAVVDKAVIAMIR